MMIPTAVPIQEQTFVREQARYVFFGADFNQAADQVAQYVEVRPSVAGRLLQHEIMRLQSLKGVQAMGEQAE